jgi:hypothetical protein
MPKKESPTPRVRRSGAYPLFDYGSKPGAGPSKSAEASNTPAISVLRGRAQAAASSLAKRAKANPKPGQSFGDAAARSHLRGQLGYNPPLWRPKSKGTLLR